MADLVKKRILILTASFGEGHNSAARGVRDGLARVAPDRSEVELHDLLAEVYGPLNEFIRRAYLGLLNFASPVWGTVYRWFDREKDFDQEFARFVRLKNHFAALLDRFRPNVVVCTFPGYSNVLRRILADNPENFSNCKNVVVVTDSITINAVWYRCAADYFFVANEQSATVLRNGVVALEKIKTFGFPVSPKFADLAADRPLPGKSNQRVLYMINAAKRGAPEMVRMLAKLDLDLTVTIGRADELRTAIEAAADAHPIKIVGWTDELPRMMHENHLLIGKAGGATVQETIAAKCPMIVNHVVAGQEEGNARLIVETNSGVIARSPREVVAQVQRAFDNDAKQWREWAENISKISRPRAALDIAEFLMAL
ncbi:MAG TPA: glycosyltransferase [Candidatus Udaeobacter sp.]|jgi:processive 1,2-diacylglycerol beta-glucosyltransferase